MAPLKALLFDIGGVAVLSPFQAIVDYEKENNIPSGWTNFAISRSAPNGYWQRLEKGEIALDDDFFKGFSEDLHNTQVWEDFQKKSGTGRKKLKDLANPSQLGDPVSLKAETADSEPTNHDRGAQSADLQGESESVSKSESPKSLKELAQENQTQLGDPVSLKAETADSEPTEQDRGAGSPSSQTDSTSSLGKPSQSQQRKSLKDLATENPSQLGDPVSLKAETADSSPTDQDRGANSPPPPPPSTSPPLPFTIDAPTLFWNMMTYSRTPDPHIGPYLTHLSSLSPRPFLLGALSNTIPFPPSHPFAAATSPSSPLRRAFDVFVASAEVGVRKPHREIYELALRELDRLERARGGAGVAPGEVLFLDDIGENLRMGREVGMRTLRVRLGETERAVGELERVTGVRRREGRGSKL
ncbi:Acyl-CoA dehydrogenase member 10 [Xylographa trunciseda]|nr:Acyl-CoA dehydrogenase member 10 [Xylographa trunciseda]